MKLLNISRACFEKFPSVQRGVNYKTATGGFCSLVVVIVFMVFFMNTAINMEDITWTSSTASLFDPSQTQLTVSPDSSSFMFATQIFSVNLNNATQSFFDVSMHEQYVNNGEFKTGKSAVQFVACTAEHFSTNKEMEQSFYSLPTYRWLCLLQDTNSAFMGSIPQNSAYNDDISGFKVLNCNIYA